MEFEAPLHYWTSAHSAEVDFILQNGVEVLPVEVKSGTNVRGRSLQLYNEAYHQWLCLRYSGLNLSKDDHLLNLPLFLCDFTSRILQNHLPSFEPIPPGFTILSRDNGSRSSSFLRGIFCVVNLFTNSSFACSTCLL